MRLRALILTLLFTLACATALQAAEKPKEDSEALAGLTTAKVVFDVRIAELEKLIVNLKLFNETLEGITGQGVQPEMIVTFRGPGVKLLTAAELDDEALDLLRALKKKGVRFEACSVAIRIFKVDPAGIIPEVKAVPNVFHSLIGYQNKGYALIVIN